MPCRSHPDQQRKFVLNVQPTLSHSCTARPSHVPSTLRQPAPPPLPPPQDWGHLPEKGPVMVHVDPGTNTPVLELPPRYKPVPGRKPLEVHAEPLVHEMLACPGGAAARLPPVRHLNGQPTAKTVKRDGGDRSELPRWSMQRNIWGKDVCLPLVWGVLAYGAAALQPKVSKAPLFITRLGGLKPNPSFREILKSECCTLPPAPPAPPAPPGEPSWQLCSLLPAPSSLLPGPPLTNSVACRFPLSAPVSHHPSCWPAAAPLRSSLLRWRLCAALPRPSTM